MTDRWAAVLADTLHEVGRRLARLAESVADDWPDRRGQEWTERAGQLRRELAERAAVAEELDSRLGSAGAGAPGVGPVDVGSPGVAPPGGGWPGAGSPAGGPSGRPGVRLGGLGGDRADNERGMRVAELPSN